MFSWYHCFTNFFIYIPFFILLLTFLLDKKSYPALNGASARIKENLKALRWSFVALAFAIRATTIPPIIAL
jgi:hypothetical protein